MKNIRLLEERVSRVVERLRHLSEEKRELRQELDSLRRELESRPAVAGEAESEEGWQGERARIVATIESTLSELRAE